jgi:excinuclease ABC subunit B
MEISMCVNCAVPCEVRHERRQFSALNQNLLRLAISPRPFACCAKGWKMACRTKRLLGVTGSGKTFSIANVIAKEQRPTIILGAQQDAGSAVVWRVQGIFSRITRSSISFPTTTTTSLKPMCPPRDTFIEKDASINEHIEQMRLSATKVAAGAARYHS